MDATDAVAQHETWCRERTAYVTAPTGNLALVGFQPVTADAEPIEGMPVTVRWDGTCEGVWVAPTAYGVTLDGVPLRDESLMSRLRPDGTPLLRAGTLAADAFSLDGSDYEMRVYDAAAPALESFDRIETYPVDPGLVLVGRLEAYDGVERVPWDFTRASDTGHLKSVPGVLALTVGGAHYRLLVFVDSGHLVLVFADGTTGESYAPGRFLRMDPPGEDGRVVVDFNRAFVPPCGFSDFYSCPIPPPQNRIAARVEAGEKRVLWRQPRH